MELKKEDYSEPCCPFELPTNRPKIDVKRTLYKFDEQMNKKDFLSAERVLDYWINEAKSMLDNDGILTLLNEKIGLYRKTEVKDKAIEISLLAISFAEENFKKDAIVTATTYLNSATAFNAFDMLEEAKNYYIKAKDIYEKELQIYDNRLGGLYNNMALVYSKLDDFSIARKYFYKAIEVMEHSENGLLEIAITYCNLADVDYNEFGAENSEEKISELLEKAYSIFNNESIDRNGYYAFVAEKCAPTFGYYGYFLYENELNARARSYYEGN